MRKLRLASKWVMLALACAVMVVGFAAVVQSPAYAARPQPDCGPTREWNCVIKGCPECPEILFEGTVCEKAAFEKKTGRVCSPA